MLYFMDIIIKVYLIFIDWFFLFLISFIFLRFVLFDVIDL